ncbi:MAG: molecular chaperone GrpE [Parvicellaceae bacterium]|jgi:molecular chaperone GrpE
MKLFGNKKGKMSAKENAEKSAEQVDIDKSESKTEEEVNTEDGDTTATENEVPELEVEQLSELDQKELEYKQLHEKFVRLYSEFDNFRKRTAKEKIDITKTASENVLRDLLPVLDDFERAIANNGNVEDPEALKEGFGLIHSKLFKNLEVKGLKRMESQGETFDVDKHEALTNIPAPSDDMKGKVVDVVEKGYLLNDKVVRFAKVVVGQ